MHDAVEQSIVYNIVNEISYLVLFVGLRLYYFYFLISSIEGDWWPERFCLFGTFRPLAFFRFSPAPFHLLSLSSASKSVGRLHCSYIAWTTANGFVTRRGLSFPGRAIR